MSEPEKRVSVNIGIQCEADHNPDQCIDGGSGAWINRELTEEQTLFLESIASELNADRYSPSKMSVSRVEAV